MSIELRKSKQSDSCYDITCGGKYVGYADFFYPDKEDLKVIRSYLKGKVKVSANKPLSVKVYIDSKTTGISAEKLGKKTLRSIVETISKKFQVEKKSIYVLELSEKGKVIIGRGHVI